MLRYCVSAAALKAFSCSDATKRIYRLLGNSVGARQRARGRMPTYYVERINRMLRLARAYGVPKHGDRLLEIGTGWLHWEAITARLFFDVRGVLFDVWDNRQMEGLKNYLQQLDGMLDKLDVDSKQQTSAHELISSIKRIDSYGDLYKLLGFEYVVDRQGSLKALEKESFDLVVSAGVLEHVPAKAVSPLMDGIATSLRRGGYSVHSINIRDHLYQYDSRVSQKQYLKYPEWAWRLCFENDVQYINRLQRSEWSQLFEKSGLVLVEEDAGMENLAGLKIAKDYRHHNEDDLRCVQLDVVYRKPQ
jgi:cyclopropane fatty-acyl-phospholipid synthase-like methyltransferase